jgi:hypothetical protein
MLTFPGEKSCWPGTGESLLVLELVGPEDTAPGDNFSLQLEDGTDMWGEQDEDEDEDEDDDDDDDDSMQGKTVCVPTYHGKMLMLIKVTHLANIINFTNKYFSRWDHNLNYTFFNLIYYILTFYRNI